MGPESDEELFAANPTTPNKRVENQIKPDPDDSDSIQQTPTKKPKTSPSKRSGPLGPIPTSYEDATSEDKMIIQMREVEGKSWAEIRADLGKRTGASFGASSLQIRYSRMKANFIVISEKEESALLQAKREVEEKMDQEKWQRIADVLEAKTGNKYPSAAVAKKFKELSKK